MEQNNTIKIPLDKGQFALVSAEQLAIVNHIKWHARWGNHDACYYARGVIPDNRPGRQGKRRGICMHRLLCHVLDNPSVEVHHRDSNGLNNTIENLQVCTKAAHRAIPTRNKRAIKQTPPHVELGIAPKCIRRSVYERAQMFLDKWPKEIPIGNCWCGCGRRTRIATRTVENRCYFLGFPTPYIFGHQTKGKPSKKKGSVFVHPNIHPFKFLDGSPKYIVNPTTGCWDWIGGKDSQGYGQTVYAYKKTKRAHVVSWELHNKQTVPKGFVVDHLCNNPGCCNPDHLEVKTQRENMYRASHVKLSAAEAYFIRTLYAACNFTMTAIAKAYNIHSSHISRIISGEKWNHPTITT